MTRRVIIIGCGGQGREIAGIVSAVDIAERANGGAGMAVSGFVDDHPTVENVKRVSALGWEVLGGTDSLGNLGEGHFLVGVADGVARERLASVAEDAGLEALVVVHPQASVGLGCGLAPGAVLWPGARLTTNIDVGRHVHINQNATIGHDTILEDFATINPAAAVSGNCTVGTRATMGTHSVVLQGLTVHHDAFVGAAACVVRSVPVGAVVKGVPAR